jgi:Zn-dependent protease with chaperone function
MDAVQINWAAVVVAALVSFGLGGLWYSPLMFAKPWMRECGLTEEQTRKANLARVFGLSLLAALVMAANLAAFIGAKGTLAFGLFAGFATGLGWVAMSLGVIYLFEQRSLKLWLIDSGYQVLNYTLMGGLLGLWK